MADNGGSEAVVPTPLALYASWAGIVFSWMLFDVLWPLIRAVYVSIRYILLACIFAVKIALKPVAFLLQPVFYLVQFLLIIIAAPIRLLAKFETLYIYLGVAALVGVVGGVLLALLAGALRGPLRLHPRASTSLRNGKEYREAARKRKPSVEFPGPSTFSGDFVNEYRHWVDEFRRGKRPVGLVAQTITEEDDSDL